MKKIKGAVFGLALPGILSGLNSGDHRPRVDAYHLKGFFMYLLIASAPFLLAACLSAFCFWKGRKVFGAVLETARIM